MDPITHTLVGANLAETRLGRGVRMGPAALIVGANLADVDVLGFVRGSDFALGFRRGWTHGVLADVLLPLVLVGALVTIDRWSRRRRVRRGLSPPTPIDVGRLLALSYLAVLSHPLLDWLNTYGVRLLMPFDRRWFYGDAVFIIDPWLWLLLGGALFLSRCGRSRWWVALALVMATVVLVNGITPLAAKIAWLVALTGLLVVRRVGADQLRGARTATVGLTVAGLYLATMVSSAFLAAGWVRGELARQGIDGVGRLMVGPLPANPFQRDVLAEVPGGYRWGSLGLAGRPNLRMGARLIETDASPVVEATMRAVEIAGAVEWMRFPFADVQETPDGYRVYLLDARYVRRRTDGFGSAVLYVDRDSISAHGPAGLP